MLACVCRPVASSFVKPPMIGAPQERPSVVTSEPKIGTATIVKQKVPGRPSVVELKAMALRQQQQIDSQHQLLAAKEQRLRFLKAQEARGAATAAEAERLRRLRERVEAQESKLRRLRALRGQVDLQKTYNVTLSNDLDSIRALFSEKEKELSLAVAKVEALTRQLEELRRDRRGLNLITGNGNTQHPQSPAARELEKLRRELMYRNQLSLQQDARLHLQREALQQRQAELRSVDQRILELQTRLHRKKASNLLLQQQQQQLQSGTNISNQNNVHPNTNIHVRSSSTHIYPPQRNNISRGNVAAVEPYNHTPQKSVPSLTSNGISTSQQQQIIQDLALLKLKQGQNSPNNNNNNNLSVPESDESKLARQKQQEIKQQQHQQQQQSHNKDLNTTTTTDTNNETHDFNLKKSNSDSKSQTLPYNSKFVNNNSLNVGNTSLLSHKIISSVLSSTASNNANKVNECDSEKAGELTNDNNNNSSGKTQQIATTVHSTPLSIIINKSVAEPVHNNNGEEKPAIKPKALHQIPSGNLVVPPRKPISSVAPTSITLAPKVISQSPKVNMVAPNNNIQAPILSVAEIDKNRPALPPKPSKNGNGQQHSPNDMENNNNYGCSVVNVINKPPMSEPKPDNNDNLPIKAKPLTIKKQPLSEQPKLRSITSNVKTIQYTSRRIEMPPAFLFPEIEKAELKDNSKNGNNNENNGNLANTNNTNHSVINNKNNQDNNSINSNNTDETDKSITPASTPTLINDEKSTNVEEIIRRKRNMIGDNVKAKLARRVSFDPLALLLDASLEGELELVKKTATQVPNPSAANDEGITALHNAICAGHLEIVKFLVQFGCDVNAQDSDGWTPLHCAASCNNLPMVRFLVESGACLFAATLSDHETPAEKCEEDEEGFDGCSEYLYSIQEKLGILNNGEVFAVFSYDAQQADELAFTVNNKLTILRKGDEAEREWWWARSTYGKEGYVPRNLLGLYPRVEPNNQNFSE